MGFPESVPQLPEGPATHCQLHIMDLLPELSAHYATLRPGPRNVATENNKPPQPGWGSFKPGFRKLSHSITRPYQYAAKTLAAYSNHPLWEKKQNNI